MKLVKIGLVAAVVLFVSACVSPAADSPTPTETSSPARTASPAVTPAGRPSPSPTATPTRTGAAFEDPRRCENDEIGFTVSYPGDWWANGRIEGGDGVQPIPACTYFAPDEVDLQPGTDDLVGIAIRFDLADPEMGRGGELIDRREVTVDGHDAVVIEREPDPTGFIPEGSTIYEYVIALDGSELVATADDIYHDAYEENKEILDRMMQTIEIDG